MLLFMTVHYTVESKTAYNHSKDQAKKKKNGINT